MGCGRGQYRIGSVKHSQTDWLQGRRGGRKGSPKFLLRRSRSSLEGRDWRGGSLLSLDRPKDGRLSPLLFLSEVHSALKVLQHLMFCVWCLHWTVVSPKRQRVGTSPQDVFTSQKNVRTASYVRRRRRGIFRLLLSPPPFKKKVFPAFYSLGRSELGGESSFLEWKRR